MLEDLVFKAHTRMKAVKDWISSQVASNSLLSSTSLLGNGSFFDQGHVDGRHGDRGSAPADGLAVRPTSTDAQTSSSNQEEQLSHQHVPGDDWLLPQHDKKSDPLAKVEALQIKFLRLVHRLGQSSDNLLVAQVLYRLHLATLIRVGESDSKRSSLKKDKARSIALAQEAAGQPDLDFSFRILVLGRSGAGKSATINSIFDETKVGTSAFRPSTSRIQEVVGTVNGIKITVIDTPGLLPCSVSNMRRNRKVLRSVKRFIRRNPPDIVLYFERLDLINAGYSDFPILKLITDTFGSAIWFSTILVMTHSSGDLPEGANGYPVSYDSFVAQCTNLVQHYIHRAVSNSKLENPVLLVDNHPNCKRNILGERVLPNGVAWRSQLLVVCSSTKVLADANRLLKFQDVFQMEPTSSPRLPSLPHLLSTLLRQRPASSADGVDNEIDDSDGEEEDEYDQLPPILILKKAQFEKLTESQKNDYLDELDYRETLYLKKQLKVDLRKRREKMPAQNGTLANDDDYENQGATPEAVQLPDMALPASFDADIPVHRYRCLITNDQWLAKPVLDPQGWDHDVGLDGINLETIVEIQGNLHATVVGQVSKEKQDFSIQSECALLYTHPRGPTICGGLDVQTAGRDLICTVRGDAKLRNLKQNTTGCGVSVTSFGNKFFIGAKVEDSISIGKRVKLVLNAGRVGGLGLGGLGQAAYGGSFETTLRGRDYPVRNEKISMTLTVLSFDKETVLGGGIVSDFRVGRDSSMSLNANLNSRKMGQICIKTSSNEHLGIGLLGLVTIARALFHRRGTEELSLS